MTETLEMNRRQFVVTTAAVGGGLALGIGLTPDAQAATIGTPPWDMPLAAGSVEFTPYVAIAPDGTITIRVPTPEIGNGVFTQVPATICEELECDWSKVKAEYASANRDLVENGVYTGDVGRLAFFGGRTTAKSRQDLLLQIGANARELLKLAAAQQLNVPVAEIEAKNSRLIHARSNRSLGFGEVAAKAAALKLTKNPELRSPKDWVRLGKDNVTKLSAPLIVSGTATYGMDVVLPNMLYAALKQAPAQGGKLKSFDFNAVKDRPGVRGVAVVDPSEPRAAPKIAPPFAIEYSAPQSAIAVFADHYWQAKSALDSMPIEWDDGPGAKWTSTQTMYKALTDALDDPAPGATARKEGDAPAALAAAARRVEATYIVPFADHATMEPMNGTAMVTADRVEVWHPSANPLQTLHIAAQETGVDPTKVFVHETFVGGSFGRRVFGDDSRMVVAVAKKMPGRPIHVIWSREESIRQGRFRPFFAGKLTAGLGADGMPTAFKAVMAGHGWDLAFRPKEAGPISGVQVALIATSPYNTAIPNILVEAKAVPVNLLPGPYRGPPHVGTAYIMECFLDECALAAGKDQVEYRRTLLRNEKHKGWLSSLGEVADKSGWGKKTFPKGTAQGLALGLFGETTAAVVATVQVTQEGAIKVQQMDVAFDSGNVLHRDNVINQIEGAQIMGLNSAINEELTVRGGRVVEGNFDDYPMLRIADAPKINVHFGGLTGGERFSEIGEPPIVPVAGALGNAIFRATGKRLRSMPFRNHDLSWS